MSLTYFCPPKGTQGFLVDATDCKVVLHAPDLELSGHREVTYLFEKRESGFIAAHSIYDYTDLLVVLDHPTATRVGKCYYQEGGIRFFTFPNVRHVYKNNPLHAKALKIVAEYKAKKLIGLE